jgi:DMSO/TMAO reductase YedYZ molybdopterin-dependent catalytic subunit
MIDKTAPTAPSTYEFENRTRAGQAGFLATLVMLAVQLIWRLNWSHDGVVQAFPEFIVAAISRLTPISWFGTATENYGSLAKKSLFVTVIIGVLVVGYYGGIAASHLSDRIKRGWVGRVISGLVVAAVFLLFTLVVVIPIAHLGFFATKSSYTIDILTQLVITFALYGVVWAIAATELAPATQVTAPTGTEVSRRDVVTKAAVAGGTIAGVAAVGGLSWRLLNPNKTSGESSAAQQATVDQIVATQQASQITPTPITQADAAALFAQLDSEQAITPVLTTVGDFYHVSKNLSDPTVSSDGWELKVTGKVNNELTLSYQDVVNRATTKKITTLCCISNELNGDLISTGEWQGFSLKDLLDEAGVKPEAIKVKFHCADDYEDSIHLDKAMDPNVIVVTGLNGAPLTDDHGAPARMIVPGIYGMKNVKWLQKIELVDDDFKGYWQTRGWSDDATNQIWGRIDTPNSGDDVKIGPSVAAGVASAGNRGISRVEISIDDGDTWADATLEPALNAPFTWVRWVFPFEARDGQMKMVLRATDGNGQVMTDKKRAPLPDGATGYPRRTFEGKN